MGNSSEAGRNPERKRAISRTRLWLTAGGALILLLIVGAGSLMLRVENGATAQRATTESGQAVGPSTARNAAPDFTVPTLDGRTFTLSAHRGKPVILFIMAYWCGTCVPEAQALARLHQQYRDRLTIIALDVDPSSTPERLQRFRQFVGNPDYVWGFDTGNVVARAYRVRALDTTFIISQAGEIVYTDIIPTAYETLEAQVKKLLR